MTTLGSPANASVRRRYVLNRMHELDYIDDLELQQALEQLERCLEIYRELREAPERILPVEATALSG